MRIPLGDLEEVRKDPGAYARRRAESSNKVNHRSKYLTLKRAVYRFHKRRENLAMARQYLEESFANQFKVRRDLALYVDWLEQYVDEFSRLGTAVIKVQDKLTVPLTTKLATQFRVSGEIPRVDLTGEGYAVWLFDKKDQQRGEELRLPLIQHAYASELGVPAGEVKVGVYNFADAAYTVYGFSDREITAARRALFRLLGRISPPQP